MAVLGCGTALVSVWVCEAALEACWRRLRVEAEMKGRLSGGAIASDLRPTQDVAGLPAIYSRRFMREQT